MEDETFETLIKSKNIPYKNRWKPLKITDIEKEIASGCLTNMPICIRKNIAYNLQYLEYLTFQLEELELNSMIINSIYKNYIVIDSSIIEAIFYWIIKDNNLCTKKDIELLFTTKANQISHNGDTVIVETNVYKKVPPYELEMTYDAMIKKSRAKNY